MNVFEDLEIMGGSSITFDDKDGADGPLTILRPTTLHLLSTMLNPIKIIPTESGLPRDWRGVAELAGLTSENMAYLETKSNHLQELLKLLPTVSSSRLQTVKDLKAFLSMIDRYDVVDDAHDLFCGDITFYQSKINQLNINSKSPPAISPDSDRDFLTYVKPLHDTIGDPLQKVRYDAFILYSNEDSEFADEVVTKLEHEYNLKLCVKERDLLPGVMFEHEAVGRLIEQRCNRLLVIFSPSFLKSEGNKFLVSFTQALALESRQRKIIPCMYKRCELPVSVRYSYCLDYNRAGKLWNFWEKLSQSLTVPGSAGSESAVVANTNAVRCPPLAQMGTSCPETYSWWDSSKPPEIEESLLAGLDKLPLPSHSPLLLLSSSLPKASTKTTSKKWYKKVMGSGKKKKSTEKQAQLVVADM